MTSRNQPAIRMVRKLPRLLCALLAPVALAACSQGDRASQPPTPPNASLADTATATATFAGGCFWCMEHPFDELPGVISTTSGYTGGQSADPTYEQVSAGGTGHAESVQVRYDPATVSYQTLLEVFWHNIDPVAVDRQFCDHGDQYRSAIFYASPEQKRLAETSKQVIQGSHRFDRGIATQVVTATKFYPAENYHQDYYKKNPLSYKFYRFNCGRDQRLDDLWGDSR